ncbi:NAD(P)/FAD-dependent oxidoreductase [bacterium]|nr:NAD(P)/FAD-dependent oxidoreductase [bacterium]
MASYTYDLIVLGGGSAGLTAAKMAIGLGKKVAIIEKEKLGGECTWSGCVPSKALIKAADIIYNNKKAQELNFYKENEQKVDTSFVMNFVRDKVTQVYQTHTPDVLQKHGVEIIFGDPKFTDKHHFMVNGKKVSAKKIIIATGSSSFIPPIEGIKNVDFLTNKTLFELHILPESIVILGGGPIGVEMASALHRCGVQVTILEMNERILPKEDEEVALLLQKKLQQDGITIKTSTRALKVEKQAASGVKVTCEPVSVDEINMTFAVHAQRLLVATGRKPNIDDLDLQKAGVKIEKNAIKVNKKLRTSASNIYACGDVIGSYQFSHVAWHQAIVATRNAFIPIFKQKIDYTHVLWITFTAPELASAGLTEKDAREKYGSGLKVYKVKYGDVDRGVIDETTHGLAKLICDKKGRLLGIHILGQRAGELLHELHVIKYLGIKLSKIGAMMHAYPSYSDIVWKAAKMARLEALQNNFFVKLYKKLFR